MVSHESRQGSPNSLDQRLFTSATPETCSQTGPYDTEKDAIGTASFMSFQSVAERNIKPAEKAHKLFDAGGLFLTTNYTARKRTTCRARSEPPT